MIRYGAANKIGLGMIGASRWANILAKTIQEHPGFDLLKVAAKNPLKSREHLSHIRQFKIISVDELLNTNGIDAVVVATDPASHYSAAHRALDCGRSVLVEKPFTETAGQAKELKAFTEQKGLKIMVDHIYTFSLAIRKMCALIEKGAIGKIIGAHMAICHLGAFTDFGVYYENGPHPLSVLDMLAPLDSFSFNFQPVHFIGEIPESGHINFSGPFSGSIFLSSIFQGKRREISIFGEKGSITYELLSPPHLKKINYRVDRKVSHAPLDVVEVEYTEFSEMNNLKIMLDNFYWLLCGQRDSNIDQAIRVAEILDLSPRRK